MGGVAWTEEEDHLLKKCIAKYGEGKWHRVPLLAGLNRCRKSCRLRWLNYLRPNIKRGTFTEDEVELIIKLQKLLGNRWSLIAGRLPGRTANDVKNYWNCHLSKKLNALEAEQKKQITTDNNVEVIIPNAANLAMIPTMMRAKTPEGPSHLQQSVLQEGSKLVPAPMLQPVGDRVILGHHGLKKETEEYNGHGAMEGDGFVGDMAGDFDDLLEEVKATCYGSRSSVSKWDWDDLIMDMDI